jgi:hypothetical protein
MTFKRKSSKSRSARKRLPSVPGRRLSLEQLESRIVFSADPLTSILPPNPALAAAPVQVSGLPQFVSAGPQATSGDSADAGPADPSSVVGQADSAGPQGANSGLVEGIPGNPVTGAVSAIATNPDNPDIIYIGTPNGGVWKTTNATTGIRTLDVRTYNDPLRSPAPDVVNAGTKAAVSNLAGSTLQLGTYKYRITYVIGATGAESNASADVTINVTTTGQQITLSNLPIGPAGTTARNIYRTPPNGASYGLIDSIDDNKTLAYADSNFDPPVLTPDHVTNLPTPPVSLATARPSEGGNLVAGTYYYRITYEDATGQESNGSDLIAGTITAADVAAGRQSLTVSGIPSDAAGTLARNIYRSNAGGGSDFAAIGGVPAGDNDPIIDSGVALLHPVTTVTVPYPHWVPLTDSMPSLSITTLVYDAAASQLAYSSANNGKGQADDGSLDVLYAGTGQVSSSASAGAGTGILKSTDGGATWQILGNDQTDLAGLNITAIVPLANNVILVSTMQNGARGGLYRSDKGGTTWTNLSALVTSGLPAGSITDLVVAGGSVFAANVGAADGSFSGAGIYQGSIDGLTWQSITKNGAANVVPDPLTSPTATYDFTAAKPLRILLSAYDNSSGANPGALVYAAVILSAADATGHQANHLARVFRWDNKAKTWSFVTDSPGSQDTNTDVSPAQQQFYDLFPGNQGNLMGSMVVDPSNGNSIYFGGDRQPALLSNGAVHATIKSARLFQYQFNASTPTATTVANIKNNVPRGTQLTNDQALEGTVPSIAGTTPTSADETGFGPSDNNGDNVQLSAGNYRYRFTFVDANGVESNPSDILPVPVQQDYGVTLSNLPQLPTGMVQLNIYRTRANGDWFYLVGSVTSTSAPFVDGLSDDAASTKPRLQSRAAPDVTGVNTSDVSDGGSVPLGKYQYVIVYYTTNVVLRFGGASAVVNAEVTDGKNAVKLTNLPYGPTGTTGWLIYRKSATVAGPFLFVAQVPYSNNGVISNTFTDKKASGNAASQFQTLDASVMPADTTTTNLVTPPGSNYSFAAGTYLYKVAFADASGNILGVSDPISVTLSAAQNTTILHLPQGPGPVTQRFIFRTDANQTTGYHLIKTLDNAAPINVQDLPLVPKRGTAMATPQPVAATAPPGPLGVAGQSTTYVYRFTVPVR